MTSSKLNRHVAWLALCVIFFGAVAPSVSHLLASTSGRAWVEVCSAYGTQSIETDVDSRQTPKAPISKEHCPFCLLQNHVPVIPTVFGAAVFAVAVISDAPLSLRNTAPPTRFIRHAHQTRAPPWILLIRPVTNTFTNLENL